MASGVVPADLLMREPTCSHGQLATPAQGPLLPQCRAWSRGQPPGRLEQGEKRRMVLGPGHACHILGPRDPCHQAL